MRGVGPTAGQESFLLHGAAGQDFPGGREKATFQRRTRSGGEGCAGPEVGGDKPEMVAREP